MTRRKGYRTLLFAVLLAPLALLAGTANALQINATWTGELKGGTGRGYIPTSGGEVLTGGGGGLFRFLQNSPALPDLLPVGANFVGFCIEFNENITSANATRNYELVELRKAPVDAAGAIPAQANGDRMGEQKANLIATIIAAVYGVNGPPDFATADPTTALTVQFAIWEIVHESLFDNTLANFALNTLLGNARFIRENGGGATTIRDAAQALIVTAVAATLAGNGKTPDEVGLLALSSLSDTDNKQDFLVWVDTPDQEVPLPPAAWLLLSGLAGLGIVSRRRSAS